MLRSTNIILFIAFCLLASYLPAQTQDSKPWCGYTGSSPWLEWYKQHREEIAAQRSGDTTWLYVPMTLHILGDNGGSGYFQLEQAIKAVCNMNSQFEPAKIRFYLMPNDPVRYTNNQAWYDHDYNNGSEMIDSLRIPGRLNAFVVQNPAGNCGYAWQDVIVLGKNCSSNTNSTWAHEAGHHFSLPHPFLGWEGPLWNYDEPAPESINDHLVEKVDSSNCYEAGDYFCDTRPDYLNFRWPCDGDSKSIQTQRDPNNVLFKSDGSLIMGYALDDCQSRFTEEQIVAMRENIYTEHSEYIQITEPLAEINDEDKVNLISPIDSQFTQYNQVDLSWEPVENATMYTVEIGLFSSFNPRLFYRTVLNTTSLAVTKGIPNNRVLFWRVRAYNEWDVCNPNQNTQVGIFRTKNLSSTNDLESTIAVELAPNPTVSGSKSTLMIAADDKMDLKISVIDATGRVCNTMYNTISYGENILEIPTENLSVGLYYVNIQNEKGSIMRRLAVID